MWLGQARIGGIWKGPVWHVKARFGRARYGMFMTIERGMVQYRPTPIDTERLGAILVKSGFFRDTRDEAQAITKILYGAELGFGPVASMLGCYLVDGRPSASAQLIASAIQKSGTFRYRVREWTDAVCRIEFFEGKESLGFSTFSMADAKRAKLDTRTTWQQYPRAMLWARALSQGARAYTPSVFNGAIYTPEELGAEVDEEGHVVETVDEVVAGPVPEEEPEPEYADDYVPTREQDPEPVRERKASDRLVAFEEDRLWVRWKEIEARAKEVGLDPPKLKLPIGVAMLSATATELKELTEQVMQPAQT